MYMLGCFHLFQLWDTTKNIIQAKTASIYENATINVSFLFFSAHIYFQIWDMGKQNLGKQMDRQWRELTMNNNIKTVFVTKLAMVSKGHSNQQSSNYI